MTADPETPTPRVCCIGRSNCNSTCPVQHEMQKYIVSKYSGKTISKHLNWRCLAQGNFWRRQLAVPWLQSQSSYKWCFCTGSDYIVRMSTWEVHDCMCTNFSTTILIVAILSGTISSSNAVIRCGVVRPSLNVYQVYDVPVAWQPSEINDGWGYVSVSKLISSGVNVRGGRKGKGTVIAVAMVIQFKPPPPSSVPPHFLPPTKFFFISERNSLSCGGFHQPFSMRFGLFPSGRISSHTYTCALLPRELLSIDFAQNNVHFWNLKCVEIIWTETQQLADFSWESLNMDLGV